MSAIKIADQENAWPHETGPGKAPDQTPAARMTPLLAFSIIVLFVLIIVAGIVLILT
jgi:hypothetical protein